MDDCEAHVPVDDDTAGATEGLDDCDGVDVEDCDGNEVDDCDADGPHAGLAAAGLAATTLAAAGLAEAGCEKRHFAPKRQLPVEVQSLQGPVEAGRDMIKDEQKKTRLIETID